jgi:hypothetical protein
VAPSQFPATRVAGGKGRGWKRQEGTNSHLIVALGGEVVDRAVRRRGIEPVAVAGSGGGTPVRERAREPAVQL